MWIVVIFAVVVIGGFAAMVASVVVRRRLVAPDGVPPLPITDAAGRARVVELAVYLALELSRVDGSITEAEIKAIEDHLTDRIVDMDREAAEHVVRRVLRATIGIAQDSDALTELVRLADHTHRAFVIELLAAVAVSDGDINADERSFAEPIAAKLGVPFEG